MKKVLFFLLFFSLSLIHTAQDTSSGRFSWKYIELANGETEIEIAVQNVQTDEVVKYKIQPTTSDSPIYRDDFEELPAGESIVRKKIEPDIQYLVIINVYKLSDSICFKK